MLKEVQRLRRNCDINLKTSLHEVPYKELNDLCEYTALELLQNEEDREYLLEQSKFCKIQAMKNDIKHNDVRFADIYLKSLLSETPFLFESYIEFLEHKRTPEKRFYEPRQKVLHPVAMDFQWLEDDPDAKFYGLSMPPRVGKSTIKLFLTI